MYLNILKTSWCVVNNNISEMAKVIKSLLLIQIYCRYIKITKTVNFCLDIKFCNNSNLKIPLREIIVHRKKRMKNSLMLNCQIF